MHDRHHEHGRDKVDVDEHGSEKSMEAVSEIVKLRKMVEHWISHNEEHARTYRLWAGRARKTGCEEPGDILEQIASEIVEQNERFMKIIDIIDSAAEPIDSRPKL